MRTHLKNFCEKYLSNLQYADDLVIISTDTKRMINKLNEISQQIGLKKHQIEKVEEYVYLGQRIDLARENQTAET